MVSTVRFFAQVLVDVIISIVQYYLLYIDACEPHGPAVLQGPTYRRAGGSGRTSKSTENTSPLH